MKKGLSLPMQFIVMAALALIVLVVVLIFMMQGQSQIGVIGAAEAVNLCDSACFQDQTAGRGVNIGGFCAYSTDLRFLQKRFVIKGEGEKNCKELTSCKLSTSTGDCMITDATLSNEASCNEACSRDGGTVVTYDAGHAKTASTNLCKLFDSGTLCVSWVWQNSPNNQMCEISGARFGQSEC